MSRPGRPPRTQQRPLTPEDKELWSTVARSLKPVRKKGRVHPFAELLTETREWSKRETLESAKPSEPSPTRESTTKPPASVSSAVDSLPPLANFDRRELKRLAKGQKEIEARIDLHGLRAAEAHAALRAFILGCYARGQRNVLVITGKGGSEQNAGERPFELWSDSDRGVLKRNVPYWLSEPELRSVVISFTHAHPRHGGEGALYVQLRRRKENRAR